MAQTLVNVPEKAVGDPFRASEVNAIVSAINNNSEDATAQFADLLLKQATFYKDVTGFTGGGYTNLDGLATTNLSNKSLALVVIGSQTYLYQLNTSGSGAESAPTLITPDDNSGYRWELKNLTSYRLGTNANQGILVSMAYGIAMSGGGTSSNGLAFINVGPQPNINYGGGVVIGGGYNDGYGGGGLAAFNGGNLSGGGTTVIRGGHGNEAYQMGGTLFLSGGSGTSYGGGSVFIQGGYGGLLGGDVLIEAGYSPVSNGTIQIGGAGYTYSISIGSYTNKIGFFGKSPATRPAPPATLGDVISALQTLGLVETP